MSNRKQVLAKAREIKNNLARLRREIMDLTVRMSGVSDDEYLNLFDERMELEQDMQYHLEQARPMHPNLFWGEKRLTFKYRTAYAHEDEWAPVGLFRILSETGRQYREDDQYGDNWTRTLRVKAPFGASQQDVQDVLDTCFNRSCRCEHDCCGHVSVSGHYVKRLNRREHLVRLNYSVNC